MGGHTRRGLALVRARIAEDPDRFVADFYTRLFTIRPALRDLFGATMAHQRAALFGVLDHVLEAFPDTASHPDLVDLLAQLGRDHRKYGVTPADFDVFCNAMLAEISATMGDDYDHELATITTQAMMLTTGVMRGAAQTAPGPATWDARVVEKFRMSRDLAVIRLVSDHPLPHAAGQYLEVSIPQWPRVWRHLSPSIPPNPLGELEFHVRAIPGGTVSSAIVGETAVGDVWRFAQNHGTLSIDPTRESVLVAGGTGIAPIRALLLQMARRADTRPARLYYGARYPGELYEAPVLARLAGSNPWLSVTVVSEEDTNPWWLTRTVDAEALHIRHRIGRLDEIVGSEVGAALDAGTAPDAQVVIAGSAPMIDNTRRTLIIAGVPGRMIDHDPV
ncbi:FAD-binding oxidoreductase [Williamsia sp. M5A3_1d]